MEEKYLAVHVMLARLVFLASFGSGHKFSGAKTGLNLFLLSMKYVYQINHSRP